MHKQLRGQTYRQLRGQSYRQLGEQPYIQTQSSDTHLSIDEKRLVYIYVLLKIMPMLGNMQMTNINNTAAMVYSCNGI